MRLKLVCFAVSIFAFSCKTGKNETYEHPGYFNSIYKQTEDLSNANPAHILPFIDSAFSRFKDPGVLDLYHKYEIKADYYTNSFPDDIQALNYLDSMLTIIKDKVTDTGFADYYANALFRKGEILIWRKDYKGAMDCFYKAKLIAAAIKDSCLISTYSNTMALINFKQEQFLEAARNMKQSVDEMNTCDNSFRKYITLQSRLNTIGFSYSKCKMPDSALYFFNKAIATLQYIRTTYPNVRDIDRIVESSSGVIYGNMGDVFLSKADTASGEMLYKKGISINSRPHHDLGDAHCSMAKLAKLYINRHDLNKARITLTSLRASLDTFNNIDAELKWYKLQQKYMDLTGNTNDAFKAAKIYMKLKDSLQELRKMPHINLEEGYERVKDQYDLAQTRKNNNIKNNFLIAVIIFSIFSLSGTALLWLNWRKTKKLNKKINKQNAEMQLATATLLESQKENNRIMQVVAHDLKNPISSMITITELLMENKALTEDEIDMLQLMNTSSKHAEKMIVNLLNNDIITNELIKEPVEIHFLLRYCVDLLQFKAGEKKQHITLNAAEATVSLNSEMIWRVVTNLIVNAIKFSPAKGQVSISAVLDNNNYVISVKDNGIGIPDDLRDKIFEPFTTAGRPGTHGEPSSGIGLSITRQIVESHKGKIWFESNPDKGTTFFVSLPM